ncbi:hypothetical protein SH601_02740 [Gracilibacillus sp. S3-1-1]|uniref:Uncharacterized protein n=1 Tax=Gracilibacillus pellucidus TaxID=3095368 RepID=A0ACC6M1R2_9BACI|nr:hypothetical protein [Gracilibacillus sp. S3-1-1]MDX8044893.1 hypothetical protein [Gracilibacillus sp. S3-1-1]
MIIQVKGKVTYPITLDPSVWIFDDRKVKLENAFTTTTSTDKDWIESNSKLNKPPVQNSIRKYNKKELLSHSYLMPIKDFIENAEVTDDATAALLRTETDEITLSLQQLLDAYLLFSIDGKQIKESGPAHLYFKDGSNQDNPIKGIKEIILQ